MSTLTISHRSFYLRFFLWVWQIDPNKLDVCKLFWGTLFFPIGFAVSAVTSSEGRTWFVFQRLGLFLIVLGFVRLLLRDVTGGVMWLVIGTFFALLGTIIMQVQKAILRYNETSTAALNRTVFYASKAMHTVAASKPAKVAGKGLTIATIIVTAPIWIPVGLVLFIPYLVITRFGDTRLHWAVDDAIDVIREYIVSVKERHCSPVDIDYD